MTTPNWSPDLRALRNRLRTLFPQAQEFTFVLGGTPECYYPGPSDLGSISIAFDDDSWVDRPDGLTTPGPDVACALAPLGWGPDAPQDAAVVDDYAQVNIRRPDDDAPDALTELWDLVLRAFLTTPWRLEPWESGEIPLR